MADWEPGDLDPEEIAAFEERLAAALEGKIYEYLAALFSADFMAAYTHFGSWDAMYNAAIAEQTRIKSAGAVDGRRHTAQITRIQELERAGDLEEAERLLLECCAIEDAITSRPPLLHFHERLAMLYERQQRFADAIEACERYQRRVDPSGGALDERMRHRLARLRKRAQKQALKILMKPSNIKPGGFNQSMQRRRRALLPAS